MSYQPEQPAGLRVLVAEDDDDLRSLLIDALEQAGHQAIELEDGFELGDYLELSIHSSSQRIRPDVIVTDVRMPGRSGLDVVREARQAGLTCPIIVISAFSDSLLRDEVRKLGRTVVLAKPIDVDCMPDLVRTMTASERAGAEG